MDTLLDNYYITFFLIAILFCVIYYYVIVCKMPPNHVIEHYYSKCCPPSYPDLVYDWKYIGKCFNDRGVGIDPIKGCLPPNPLLRPFNNAKKPKNFIF